MKSAEDSSASLACGTVDSPVDNALSQPTQDGPGATDTSRDRTANEPNNKTANETSSTRAYIERNETRNLLSLAGHHVMLRIGWIFKTESVVMPAFFDAITPGAWASTFRGFLPVLNRLGQSIPPLLFARRLTGLPRKKFALFAFSTCMGVAFLTLAVLLLTGVGAGSLWLPIAFLAIYASFFSCVGLGNLSFATLQGKLIHPTRRGRLLTLHT
ncbi:MAG: hypothetical protein MPJ50_12145, partial [Pirellulales bacterium]|nr:hypothetical protein [Pirellulales bacterium]